ncbi:selenium-dependent molybdenum cofactor biosynthesis protein YqeB [Anaerolineales bacterium HSG6]|nr:selenium-dependent molybdenum cofactor biosynthesis protein YqeB [Anaerolineales bacterium HSG6]MDM8530994.1 selenium-dependent molybdenum cofactor biosynthesis protein YqeB [Anaerolineales bacterium HSG25]
MLFNDTLVLIKGAGDLASGIAYRLKRAGFPLIMTEQPQPTFIRRAVSYGEAVYSREVKIEGITARLVDTSAEARQLSNTDMIPVLIDPEAKILSTLNPVILVDAIMSKKNNSTSLNDTPFVIGLGPGFEAEVNCHAIIETKRGHWLGRVIYEGEAEPNSGQPGPISGYTADRVIRTSGEGYVIPVVQIGALLNEGDLIATIDNQPIEASFAGVLRGLIHPNVWVKPGFKIGDLDPRSSIQHCFTISDKSLAIGGGVLEAVLAYKVAQL